MQIAMETLVMTLKSQMSGGEMSSPAHKSAAISAIEKDEGLSDNEFDKAIKMLISNSNASTMYLAIKNPKARTCFLQSQLHKFSMT